MNTMKRLLVIGMAVFFLLDAWNGEAALQKGAVAPSIPSLEKNEKRPMKRPMSVLYFFTLASKPGREGLDYLKDAYDPYRRAGIALVAVSKDRPEEIDAYLKTHPLPFPVVKDDGKIFKAHDVQFILPTTLVLGVGRRVTDVLEGGGPSSQHFMTTVAQRALQLKKTDLAKQLYTQVLKQNPNDAAGQNGLGQVLLKEGKLDQAETVFAKVSQLKAPEAILGKEGLAAVQLEKGNNDAALAIAEEIHQKDPENGLVHLLKGNILASQGDQKAALVSYNKALEGKLSSDGQQAEALNQAGRIYSDQGQYDQAESMYERAVNQNPFSSEILTNRGALYEKRGEPQKALALYQEALMVDPDDNVAHLLAKRMMQHLDFKEDMERQKRVDTLVAELTDRFQKGALAGAAGSDAWSSRPMTVAFIGMKTMGGSLLREGMAEVLQQEMGQRLMASGRISVVEREIMDKLLTELKLGSSELADPDTALKLGKLLAARLIVTGALIQVPGGLRLSLRLIDPETSAIKLTYSDEMGPNKNLMTLADETGKILGERIQGIYPLQGKIALVEAEGQVIVNLGKKHGMLPGTEMKIIAEGNPIVIDGKVIGHRKQKVGLLRIETVEDGMSYGKVSETLAKVEIDQKVMENVAQK